jgi:hypothetical protein
MPKKVRDPDAELFTNSARREQLRDLLFRWDPIGFAAELPRDEYDCLIPTVVRLLRSDTTDRERMTQLQAQVRDHFGLDVSDSATLAVAAELRDWYRRPTPEPR